MFDSHNYTYDELIEIQKKIAADLEARRISRFNTAVSKFIAAYQELVNAYPYASCCIEIEDEDCGNHVVDVFDYSPSELERMITQ